MLVSFCLLNLLLVSLILAYVFSSLLESLFTGSCVPSAVTELVICCLLVVLFVGAV